MIMYLIKTVACSGALLGIYVFFLSKESTYRFNRIYLLLSLVIPFVLPFVYLPVEVHQSSIVTYLTEPVYRTQAIIINRQNAGLAESSGHSGIFSVAFILYVIISGLLLYRFIRNVISIMQIIGRSTHTIHAKTKLVLLTNVVTPHSFLNYIFLSKTDFEQNRIDARILTHEIAHVKEKHSLDVLLSELLLVFCWWNPFLYLYKKFIQANHEFIADASVLHTHENIATYQRVLLETIVYSNHHPLASQFNFSITKKRFLMMTKHTSVTAAACKQACVLLLTTVIVLLFASKPFAQSVTDSIPGKPSVSTGAGASRELLDEYDASIKNMLHTITLKSGRRVESVDMSKGDMDRLAYIYRLMNAQQREERFQKTGIKIDSLPVPQKNAPSAAQLQKWRDAKTYGVWIDGKRIANNTLTKYDPSDFALYTPSRLEKNAVQNDKFLYQIDLMTPVYYSKVWESETHYIPLHYKVPGK